MATTTTTEAATTTTQAATTTTVLQTTTTEAVLPPDLTPTLTGASSALPEGTTEFELTIRNVGDGPTTLPMLFYVQVTVGTGTGSPAAAYFITGFTSSDWTFEGFDPNGYALGSNTGLVLAPGATSTISFPVTWIGSIGGETYTVSVDLPAGIGGETNGANNSTSQTVDIILT